MKKQEIAIITNIIPTYREGFFNRLFSYENVSIKVYCQERIPGMNLKTIHETYPKNVTLMKFIAADNEKIVWQFIPFLRIMRQADVIFIDGNPRYISQALFATFLRLIGRKIVVWSMAHSFRDNSFSESIRINWLKLFKYHFFYTDLDIQKLKIFGGFDRKIMSAMNNGLDQKKIDTEISTWSPSKLKEWQEKNNLSDKIVIISSGRLSLKNQYDLLIKALPIVAEKFPNILWFAIGDGIARQNLENSAKAAGISDHVRFVGEMYNEADLCPYFLSSEFFVHPASIGLSLMHAFGYGLPVIAHGNAAKHGPEFGAFEVENTGRIFEEGNSDDLAKVITVLLGDQENLRRMQGNVQKIVREKYNADVMANRFVQMVESVLEG